jgi:hypothetical protein
VEHVRLEEVADGARAAVAVPDTGSVGNVAIVRAGGDTIVFDTFLTPQAARFFADVPILERPVRMLADPERGAEPGWDAHEAHARNQEFLRSR